LTHVVGGHEVMHPNHAPAPSPTHFISVLTMFDVQPSFAIATQQQQQQALDSSSSSHLPLLAYDDSLLRHVPPLGSSHPERPDRTAAIMARLHATGLVGRCRKVSVCCCVR
jgi:hypothetical protein